MYELTTEQRAAVRSEAAETYVQAGPGSGKTLVLAERVRWLLDSGTDPKRILALTFTRRAAQELRGRTGEALAQPGTPPAPPPIVCGTFHSVALGILEQHGKALGYSSGLTVLDAREAEEVFDALAADLGMRDKKTARWTANFKLRDVLAARDRFYQTGRFECDIQIERLIRIYHERLFSLNSLDFGLILTQTRHLLMAEFSPATKWAEEAFDHVLIDEAQDCDEIQFSLHFHFAPPAALFMVGDRRQCIYGWRGARPEMLQSLRPGAVLLELTNSFRCTDAILRPANALMDKDETMRSARSEGSGGGDPQVITGRSRDIASVVTRLHHVDQFAWGEIAVLCRTHNECKRIGSVFADARVPSYRVGSGFDPCKGSTFRDVYAALRLTANMRDDLAFGRVARYLDLSSEALASLRRIAVDEKCTRFEAAGRHHSNSAVITAIARHDGDTDLSMFLERLIPAMTEAVDDAAIGRRPGSLGEYQDAWNFWHHWQRGRTIASALSWFATRDTVDDGAGEDEVTISTIHAAKGLEWRAVVVPNLTEGSLPTSRSIRGDGVEEERRVLYVAMTRAFDSLTLHYRRYRDQSEKGTKREPSRFLQDCGLLAVGART